MGAIAKESCISISGCLTEGKKKQERNTAEYISQKIKFVFAFHLLVPAIVLTSLRVYVQKSS